MLVFAKFSFKVYIEILEKFDTRYRTIISVPNLEFDKLGLIAFYIWNREKIVLAWIKFFKENLDSSLNPNRVSISNALYDLLIGLIILLCSWVMGFKWLLFYFLTANIKALLYICNNLNCLRRLLRALNYIGLNLRGHEWRLPFTFLPITNII